jgi:hypothetical protein
VKKAMNLRAVDFPYLRDLLGGYFHQDAFASGETVEDILRDFKETSWEYQRLGVRADVQRILHEHDEDGLLAAFIEAFEPNVIIGQTDGEARAFLKEIDTVLQTPPR